jgi:hypothetical protein
VTNAARLFAFCARWFVAHCAHDKNGFLFIFFFQRGQRFVRGKKKKKKKKKSERMISNKTKKKKKKK